MRVGFMARRGPRFLGVAILIGLVPIASSVFAQCCPGPPLPAIDPVLSTVSAGGARTAICPAGDLPGLLPPGSNILVQVRDCTGLPFTGLLPRDFEVDGAPLAAMADGWNPGGVPPGSPPRHNLNGFTVIAPGDYLLNTPILGGGCGPGLNVKVRGCLITTGAPLPQDFVSPDANADGVVNLADLGAFAACFSTPGCTCCDLNPDGVCNLSDVGVFAMHFGHTYPPGFTIDPVD